RQCKTTMSRCAVSQQISWRVCWVLRQGLSSLRSRARRNRHRCSSISARPLRRLRRRRRRENGDAGNPACDDADKIVCVTTRVAQAWGVGRKERRNGIVVFVFIQDRKIFIQVGYGLEGALPDATAFDITERRIKPLFRNGDYQAGLATGIDLICKAIRGEYKG